MAQGWRLKAEGANLISLPLLGGDWRGSRKRRHLDPPLKGEERGVSRLFILLARPPQWLATEDGQATAEDGAGCGPESGKMRSQPKPLDPPVKPGDDGCGGFPGPWIVVQDRQAGG
jgi:hypothetical protein